MTRGHQELNRRVRQRMREQEISQNDVARLVGADSGNFSGLMRGERKPGLELGGRLFAEFGIEIDWWSQPADESPDPIGEAS